MVRAGSCFCTGVGGFALTRGLRLSFAVAPWIANHSTRGLRGWQALSLRSGGGVGLRSNGQGARVRLEPDGLTMTMNIANIPIWFPFLILISLLLISAILSTKSGWRRIAARFPHKNITDHRKYYFVRMSLGSGPLPVAYGGCVIVRLSPQGLGLSVIFLIRFLHPPIFVPWSEVSSGAREFTARYDVTKIKIRNEESVLSFYGRVGENIYASYVAGNSHGKS